MKKIVLLAFSIGFFAGAYCQQQPKQIFVRVFDADKKIHKGFVQSTTDSSISLYLNHNYVTIPVTQISTLKLRRSFGSTPLITTIIFGSVGGTVGALTSHMSLGNFSFGSYRFTPAPTSGRSRTFEDSMIGFASGAVLGAAFGAVISALRSRPVFSINHSRNNWQKIYPKFKAFLQAQ